MERTFHFAGFEADRERFQLRCGTRAIRLERIPLELLFLLLESRGKLVSRAHIVAKLWGSHVFLDTERGINTAVRKLRRVLDDDPQHPRFIETVFGKGYRFIAPLTLEQGDENPHSRNVSCMRQPCGELSAEEIEVRLHDFRVDHSDGAPHLVCEVSVNEISLGRMAIVKLELPANVALPLNTRDRLLLKLHGVRVNLTMQAVQALHAVSISALEGGLRVQLADSAA